MASPLRMFAVMQERREQSQGTGPGEKEASAETGDRKCSRPSLLGRELTRSPAHAGTDAGTD